MYNEIEYWSNTNFDYFFDSKYTKYLNTYLKFEILEIVQNRRFRRSFILHVFNKNYELNYKLHH